MIQATSCGGVVIFRGKILLLYKNFKNRYEGWVLPKGTVEMGEKHVETALREENDYATTTSSLNHGVSSCMVRILFFHTVHNVQTDTV